MTQAVFISYSWDSDEHKDWVRKLADYLINNGVDVILDQYELSAGKNMTFFMETAIEKADKVLMILTPKYKSKADNRDSGVGYEYSMITAELFEIQNKNTKFIPILREGNKENSSPNFLKTFVYHDLSHDDRFESDAFELLRIILDKPKIQKPKLGNQPDFENAEKDPVLEIAKSIRDKEDLERRKKLHFESSTTASQVYSELEDVFQEIKKKAEEYRESTGLFFRAEYERWSLVLIFHGFCLNIYYSDPTPGYLDGAELIISVWDKALSVNNDLHYFPSDQPKELKKYKLKPVVNDKLNVVWKSKEIEIEISDLKSFSFEKLMGIVKDKKNLR